MTNINNINEKALKRVRCKLIYPILLSITPKLDIYSSAVKRSPYKAEVNTTMTKNIRQNPGMSHRYNEELRGNHVT